MVSDSAVEGRATCNGPLLICLDQAKSSAQTMGEILVKDRSMVYEMGTRVREIYRRNEQG